MITREGVKEVGGEDVLQLVQMSRSAQRKVNCELRHGSQW